MINKKKFAKLALKKNIEAFIIYVIFWLGFIIIYLAKKTQNVLLFVKKVKILAKYLDFLNVFSEKITSVLSKLIKLNQYIIELQNNKQLLYKQIYSPKPVKHEILKIYIKINLTNNFI